MATTSKAGRNDVCPCGSGKKFKKCCAPKHGGNNSRGNTVLLVIVGLLIVGGVAAGINAFTSERNHVARPTGVWDPAHGHYH